MPSLALCIFDDFCSVTTTLSHYLRQSYETVLRRFRAFFTYSMYIVQLKAFLNLTFDIHVWNETSVNAKAGSVVRYCTGTVLSKIELFMRLSYKFRLNTGPRFHKLKCNSLTVNFDILVSSNAR